MKTTHLNFSRAGRGKRLRLGGFVWYGALACMTMSMAFSLRAQDTNTVDSASTPNAQTTNPAAPADSAPVAPKKKNILSLENADMRQVLQAMAKQSGMSIIIPDDVKGTVTARFENKTPEQAMRTLLEDKGFSLVELDGVYRIKSRDSIAAEPTKTEIYQFVNASAKETKPTVEKLLTKSGNVQLDERSNTIVITDVPSNLAKVLPIIKTLDTPTPQVIIESKLLETTQAPTLNMGVNWQSLSSYTVSAQGVQSLTVAQSTVGTTTVLQTTSTTAFGNFSAPINSAGATGIKLLKGLQQGLDANYFPVFGQLSAPQFQWTLSFLLSDSDTELLASPKVITTDNKEAKIRIATQEPIPNFTFNQQTASFVISGFDYKDVGNILTVTPHVNRDNNITLDVTPEVSTSDQEKTFALPGGSVDIPLISIRTLTSRVMVKSGNTLALGGLLSSNNTRGYTKVPFFGDIPFLGELFRSRSFSKNKRNLMIFITPTVIGTNGQTGLEDQYNRLRDNDEDGRFAYKKDLVGNAKPLDQFRTVDDIERMNAKIWNDKSKKPDGSPTVAADQPSEMTPPPAPAIDPNALAPVISPGLREE